MQTTEALIAEYDQRIATRFYQAPLGGPRQLARQRKINAIVDELGRRADQGDAVAIAWYEEA